MIECGASPGSWSQVAAPKINAGGAYQSKRPAGVLIGCDLLPIEPVEGTIMLSNADFTAKQTQDQIREIIGQQKIDLGKCQGQFGSYLNNLYIMIFF